MSDRKALAAFVLLTIATSIVYLPVLFSSDFFNDDLVYVTRNSTLQRASILQILTSRVNDYEFLPLRDLTYWIDWRLFGNWPLPYRLHSLIWYAGACIAAWFAALRLAEIHGASNSRFIAFSALTIFALHPLHVESVAWIASRKDLVAGVFVLLATALWTRGLEVRKIALCWVAAGLFLFALAGKTMAIVFPVIAFVLWWRWNREWSWKWGGLSAFLVGLAAGWLLLALSVGATTSIALESGTAVNPPQLVARIAGMAFWKTLFPTDLRLIYDELSFSVTPGFSVYAVIGVALGVLAGYAGWRYLREGPLWAFGAIWFCVFLMPYLQIIPFRTWSVFSDRFAFLPVFGFAIIVSVGLSRLDRVWRVRILIAIALVLSTLSLLRTYDWRSNEALLTSDALRTHGSSLMTESLVDTIYLPSRRYDEALVAAQHVPNRIARRQMEIRIQCIRLRNSGDRQAWLAFAENIFRSEWLVLTGDTTTAMMFGGMLLEYGRPEQAEAIFMALKASGERLPTTWAGIRFNLALAIERQGRFEDALRAYKELAANSAAPPRFRAMAWNSQGALFNRNNDPQEAEVAFVSALALDPSFEYAAANLVALYDSQGRAADLQRLLEGPAGRMDVVRQRVHR